VRYLPLTEESRNDMLSTIGVDKVSDLYKDIPKEDFCKFDLPKGKTEQEVVEYFKELSDKNVDGSKVASFLGGGCYRHFIPSSVDAIITRAEFLTSYTPYQPEISQGTLVTIFEFQTYICELTGMDVANASMYDGATSLVEAVLMAGRIQKKKNKYVIGNALNPDYERVLRTYLDKGEILEEGVDAICDETNAVIVSYPDFRGEVADLDEYRKICDEKGALLIVLNCEIVSLGLLQAPRQADIFVGEGQSLGVGLNYGGPHLGIFACKEKYTRQMPGRICGETTDVDGKRGFVLTLNAREQHIRRSKATSNICSNQGLNVVAFTVHLSLLGKNGLEKLAKLNHYKTKQLALKLSGVKGIKVLNETYFNEFVIDLENSDGFLEFMKKAQVFAGVKIDDNRVLVAVTELNSNEDLDLYIRKAKEFLE
jgi:glycine dehydrogenase subunit 1